MLWGISSLSACIRSCWQICPSCCIIKWSHFRAVSPRLIFSYVAHPISLNVNQAVKKPVLPGWRLGRCALQWLWGQCTIVTDANQVGQSKPLHLRRRRYLKAMGVSRCSGGLPMEAASTRRSWGQPQPRASGKPVVKRWVWGQAGKSIHWSGSGPVGITRVRLSLQINRQVHRGKIKLGHQLAELETGVLWYHWGWLY